MICRSFLLCTAVLLFIGPSENGLAQTSKQEQVWQGTMEIAPGASITVQIRTRQEGDKLKATLRKVNPDGPQMEVDQFEIKDKQVQLKVEVGEVSAQFAGTLNDAGDEMAGTWEQLGREIPLKLVRKAQLTLLESWKGTLVDGPKKLEFQFRVLKSSDGTMAARFDSLSEKKLDWNAETQRDEETLLFRVPELEIAFVGRFDESGEKANGDWITKSGRLPIELVRTANSAATQPELPAVSRPQTPKAPFPYDSTEITFENVPDKVTLAGTLTFPRAEKGSPKKVPAVVLITGSGPQDRDETIYEHKPFFVIADNLTRAGFAVLRFDDRGVGKSTGDFSTATSADFANDVRAAIRFLQNHEKIDPGKIGLIGHSEGGLIAPMVAASNPDDVAFIVLMAGPGVNGYEILRDQGRRIAEAEGIPVAEIAQESALRDAVSLAVRNAPEIVDGDLVVENAINQFVASYPLADQDSVRPTAEQVDAYKQLASPWFRFFLRYEPSSSLQNVRCPVLAFNGELDLQVWHETNLKAVAAALKAAGNTNFRAVRLPKLNHLFQRAQTGAVSEYAEIDQTIATEVLDLMRNWIKKQVK